MAVGGGAIPIDRRLRADFFFGFAVVFGVELAGFRGVMRRVGGVTGGDMGVMTRGLCIAGFVMRGGFAMVMGGLLEMVGRLGVVLVRTVRRRHVNVLSGLGGEPIRIRSQTKHRSLMDAAIRKL